MNDWFGSPWFNYVMLAIVSSLAILLQRSHNKLQIQIAWHEWQKAVLVAKIGRDALLEITKSATADVETVEFAFKTLREIDQIASTKSDAA